MRVGHVSATIDDLSAGPSHSVRNLCEHLRRKGVEVDIHTLLDWRSPPTVEFPSLHRHRQNFKSVPGLGRLGMSSAMSSALKAAAAHTEVIHTHGLWLMPNIYPAWAVKGTACKTVLSPRGMLGDAALGFSSLKKSVVWALLQRRAVAATDCLHATCEAEHDEIRRYGIGAPVAVIPNGVDLPDLSRASPREKIVLSLGRIHPKKGLPNLIRAWSALEGRHPDWRLRIVGPSELGHAEELRRLAKEIGLSRVSIDDAEAGDAKTASYRQASVFVLPSLNENFALTVAEALAAETPVIATYGTPWRGLREERCGWWVDHGPDALAQALSEAISTSPEQLRAMGARGRAWMERDFSWPSVADQMRAVYGWLTHGGSPPSQVRFS